MNSGKEEAHEFLNNFEDLLARQLPVASEMEGWVRRIVCETKGDHFLHEAVACAYGAMAARQRPR